MRIRLPIMLALVMTATGAAAADQLVTIPLPSLNGTYPGDQAERTAPFLFEGDPALIVSVILRTGGKATDGSVYCGGKDPEPWLMDVGAVIFDPGTGGWWTAWIPAGAAKGDFAGHFTFTGSRASQPSWNFLGDGPAELHYYAGPMSLIGICGPVVAEPTAEVTEVSLLFHLSSAASAEPATWSTLKALYR